MTTRLEDLQALRELLWSSLHAADADKRAPLAARLESVVEQIEQLTPAVEVGDSIDEIAARRAARGGATARERRSDGAS